MTKTTPSQRVVAATAEPRSRGKPVPCCAPVTTTTSRPNRVDKKLQKLNSKVDSKKPAASASKSSTRSWNDPNDDDHFTTPDPPKMTMTTTSQPTQAAASASAPATTSYKFQNDTTRKEADGTTITTKRTATVTTTGGNNIGSDFIELVKRFESGSLDLVDDDKNNEEFTMMKETGVTPPASRGCGRKVNPTTTNADEPSSNAGSRRVALKERIANGTPIAFSSVSSNKTPTNTPQSTKKKTAAAEMETLTHRGMNTRGRKARFVQDLASYLGEERESSNAEEEDEDNDVSVWTEKSKPKMPVKCSSSGMTTRNKTKNTPSTTLREEEESDDEQALVSEANLSTTTQKKKSGGSSVKKMDVFARVQACEDRFKKSKAVAFTSPDKKKGAGVSPVRHDAQPVPFVSATYRKTPRKLHRKY